MLPVSAFGISFKFVHFQPDLVDVKFKTVLGCIDVKLLYRAGAGRTKPGAPALRGHP